MKKQEGIVLTRTEKDTGRYCNENNEDGSEWTPTHRKTETGVERFYTNIHEYDRGTERSNKRTKKLGECKLDAPAPNIERVE